MNVAGPNLTALRLQCLGYFLELTHVVRIKSNRNVVQEPENRLTPELSQYRVKQLFVVFKLFESGCNVDGILTVKFGDLNSPLRRAAATREVRIFPPGTRFRKIESVHVC